MMRHRGYFIGLSLGAVVAAQACGGSTADDGLFDGSSPDATADVSTQNDSGNADVTVGGDTGTPGDTGTGTETGTVDAGTDSGSTGIGMWTCGTVKVSDCSMCTGFTMPCVYCANADASTLAGSCVQEGLGCGNGAPMGYNLCRCAPGDAGACPESFQVCLGTGTFQGSVCDTCGAVAMTNGLTCHGGGTCDAVDGGCL